MGKIAARSFIALASVALLAAALEFFVLPRVGQPPRSFGQPLIGGAFALQSGDGRVVTEQDLLGHPSLVFFGYAHCPDICPTTLAQLSDVLAKLPAKPVRVYFVTVDPERDDPKLMGEYVSSFDPRIVGLSGSPEAIERMEKAYRVYARKNPGRNGEYSFDHSSIVYLMDRAGHFVEAFNLDRSAVESAKELQAFL